MESPTLPTSAEIEQAISGNNFSALYDNIQAIFQDRSAVYISDDDFDTWLGREYKRILKAILSVNDSSDMFHIDNTHITLFLHFINQNPLTKGIIQAISYAFSGGYTKSVSDIPIHEEKKNPSQNESVLKHKSNNLTVFNTFVDGLLHSSFLKKLITVINSENDTKVLSQIITIFEALKSSVKSEFLIELFIALYTRIIVIIHITQSVSLIGFIYDYVNSIDDFLLEKAIDSILSLFDNDNYSIHIRIMPVAAKLISKSKQKNNLTKLRKVILKCFHNCEEIDLFEQVANIISLFTNDQIIRENDCVEILSQSRVKDKKLISQIIIQCIQSYKYGCAKIANHILLEKYVIPDLILYLIDYVPDYITTSNLFNLLLKNFCGNQGNVTLKKPPGSRLLQLLIEASARFDEENFDAITFLLGHYQLKSQICSLIDSLAESAMRNNDNFAYFDKCKYLTHHIIDQTTSEYLFKLIVRLIQTNNDSKYLDRFISFVTKWIAETDNSLFLRSIEPLFTMTEIPLTKIYYPLYCTITAKGVKSPRLLEFLMNIVQSFDQPQYCYWLSKSIIHLLQGDEPVIIDKYISLLFNMLEIPEKFEIAEKMLFLTTSLTADAILPSKDISCGFSKDFTVHQNNKVRKFSITIHPQHSCRRIYYAYALHLGVGIRRFNLFVRFPNGTKKFVNPHFPISTMPLDIDEITLEVVNRNDTDYIDVDADLLYICAIIIEKIRNNTNDLLSRALNSEYIPRILTMVGDYDEYFKNFVPDPDDIFIYPFYIRWCIMNDIYINPKELLSRIDSRKYGIVGREILIECLYDYEGKIVFTFDELKSYLIHNSSDSFRELIIHLGNFESQQSAFLSLVSETLLPQYRNNTKQFYSIFKNFQPPPEVFALFLKDMKHFETSPFSPTDETFIGLIRLTSPTEEISDIVFNMLFKMPIFSNTISPFLQTKFSREEAFDYFTKKETMSHFLRFLQPLPILSGEPNSKISFYHHAGIQNEGSTCYAAAVMQCLSSFYCFTNKLFVKDQISEYGFKMRSILASTRYVRTYNLSIHDYLSEFKTFDKAVQQDACEFFGKALELLEENEGVDMIKDFQGIISTKYEDCEEKEEPFVLLSVKTKGFSNLLESIRSTFSPEFISDYHHTQKQKYGVTRSSLIKSWPRNLVLQLQRWEFDSSLMYRKKLEGYFGFPMSLPCGLLKDLTGTSPDSDYSLSAIIVHVGQAETGHYYAIVKEGDEWLCCNDTTVSTIDISQIPIHAFGINTSNNVYTPTGYMLFYTQNDGEYKPEFCDNLIKFVDNEQKKYWQNYIFNNKQTIDFISTKFSDTTDDGFLINLVLKFKIQTNDISKTAKVLLKQTERFPLIFSFIHDHLDSEFPKLFHLAPVNDGQVAKLFRRVLKTCDDFDGIKYVFNLPKDPNNDKFSAFCAKIVISVLSKSIDWSDHADILKSFADFINTSSTHKARDKQRLSACFKELCRVEAELVKRGVVTHVVLDILRMKELPKLARPGGDTKQFELLVAAIAERAPEAFLLCQDNKRGFERALGEFLKPRVELSILPLTPVPTDLSRVPELMVARSRAPEDVYLALSEMVDAALAEERRKKTKRSELVVPIVGLQPDQIKPPQPPPQMQKQQPSQVWPQMIPAYACAPYPVSVAVQYPPFSPWVQPQQWVGQPNQITCQVHCVNPIYQSPPVQQISAAFNIPTNTNASSVHSIPNPPKVSESYGLHSQPKKANVRRIQVEPVVSDPAPVPVVTVKKHEKEQEHTLPPPVVRKFTRHVIANSDVN